MGTINVNGKIYKGNNISITNGHVIIDGKEQDGEKLSGVVKVIVEGDIENVKSDESIEVKGNVKGNVDAGGSVQCENVGGDVDAGGSINAGDIEGDVDAGGSVNCGKVGGDIDAGGSVVHN